MSVEPGITIGFLNRLLVAEGLTLGVVPEVPLMICTIVPTSSLVYRTTSVTLILVAVSNDNNHFHHYSVPIFATQVDHLTVGGLVLGGGLESTSHKHGMFHQVYRDDSDDQMLLMEMVILNVPSWSLSTSW